MPELPEVETIRRDLAPRVTGGRVREARILDPRIVQGFAPGGGRRRKVHPREVERALRGRVIAGVGRRGKYLVFNLEGATALLAHLRMTGQILWGPPHPRARARVAVAGPGGEGVLNFCDTRRFGEIWLSPDWRRDPSLRVLGPEPLDVHPDLRLWGRDLRKRRSPLQAALLDQTCVAGMGNIYVTEALHLAGLRPTRRCHTLQAGDVEPLWRHMGEVLRRGLDRRGVSFRDYRDALGKRGEGDQILRAYGRAGQPCLGCGTVLKAVKVGGRGTVYCPRCQK
jgi:formamidopyrimidine-DNA glycosylase